MITDKRGLKTNSTNLLIKYLTSPQNVIFQIKVSKHFIEFENSKSTNTWTQFSIVQKV